MHACIATRHPIVMMGIMLYAKVSPFYNVLWECIVVVYTFTKGVLLYAKVSPLYNYGSALLLFIRKLHCLQTFEHMSALWAIKA